MSRQSEHATATSHIKNEATPATSFLTLARVVGVVAALSAGLAVGLGSYTDIVASDGPANFILPFVIAIAVALGLGAGWHVVLAMGAAANSTEVRITTVALGFGLAIIGAGTSAWFLAAKIGGSTAIKMHQQSYLMELSDAEQKIAANIAREKVLISAAGRAQEALQSTARDEGSFGAVSGKAGFASVFSALTNAAGGFQNTQNDLQRLSDQADSLLAQARLQIDGAGKAIAARNTAEFEEAVGSAVARLGDANRIRLGDALLGAGDVAASGAAASIVSNVTENLRRSVRTVSGEHQPVSLPAYIPIDAKTAVVTYPQPLPWLMAILIESLPLLMLGIMIVLSISAPAPREDARDDSQFNVGSDDYDRAKVTTLPAPNQPRARRSNRHRRGGHSEGA